MPTWHEDFREDLKRVDVPTLVIHSDADRIVPISASGLRTVELIKGARLFVVTDWPHCITWTHADEVNSELPDFLGQGVTKDAASAPRELRKGSILQIVTSPEGVLERHRTSIFNLQLGRAVLDSSTDRSVVRKYATENTGPC